MAFTHLSPESEAYQELCGQRFSGSTTGERCAHDDMAQIPESGPAGFMWCLNCHATDDEIAGEAE
jgi:hypothetical protein